MIWTEKIIIRYNQFVFKKGFASLRLQFLIAFCLYFKVYDGFAPACYLTNFDPKHTLCNPYVLQHCKSLNMTEKAS